MKHTRHVSRSSIKVKRVSTMKAKKAAVVAVKTGLQRAAKSLWKGHIRLLQIIYPAEPKFLSSIRIVPSSQGYRIRADFRDMVA